METQQIMPVDEQLHAWLAAGAYRPALTLLAETYLEPVFRYCLRMCQGQAALAEEVTQQVFEAACRGIAQFRAEASAKTWLFAIAHHQALHALARQRRQGALQQLASQTRQAQTQTAPSSTPEDGVPTHEDVARLRLALTHAALAPVDRSIVRLRFGIDVPQALSVTEVATVLGLSRDMVYRRLKHTLAQLRRIMDDDQASQETLCRHGPERDDAVKPGESGYALPAAVTRSRAGADRGPRIGRAVRPGAASPSGRARYPLSSVL
jgi:RNA polymerase sigma-70 factor (ECF subfamily)